MKNSEEPEQLASEWLFQKPTDLGLHCLQRQGMSGVSRTRVKHTCSKVLNPKNETCGYSLEVPYPGAYNVCTHKIYFNKKKKKKKKEEKRSPGCSFYLEL